MSGMADFSNDATTNDNYLSSFGVRDMINGYPEVYMDFWYLYDPANPPSRNHKLFRFYTGFDQGQPDRYMNVYCGRTGGWTMESDGGGTSNWYGSPWWVWANADKQWSHFQGYFKTNTDGASNGIIKFWINHFKGIDASNWVHRPSGSSVWRSLWFGNYLGHDAAAGCGTSPGDSFTFWDNVYIDVTQARVEIGNAPNYESCTHREIQVPSSWSESSISLTVNQGSFADFSQAYLFVIDANGGVSPGYPLSGGAPPPPPPPPPSDTTPPAVAITAPANGTTVSGTAVAISASASDNVGVVGVQFRLDGANLGAEDVSVPYSIAWNTTQAANNAHTLSAVARDAAGNTTTSAAVTVTVSNAAPPPPAQAPSAPRNLRLQ